MGWWGGWVVGWVGEWAVSSPASRATLRPECFVEQAVTAAIEGRLGGVAGRVSMTFRPDHHQAPDGIEQVQLVPGGVGPPLSRLFLYSSQAWCT